MTPEELIEEGRRLARPVALLSDEGTDYAGIWGGDGLVPASDTSLQHWLTIDLSHVPSTSLKGCLSVYSDGIDLGECSYDPVARLPHSPTGVRLNARKSTSLPPIEDVLRHGSPRVRAWLKDKSWWDARSGYSGGDDSADAYVVAYQASNPLYAGSAWVMLGGWPMLWPEDDATPERSRGAELVAWTFRDAEPWLEVWLNDGAFSVVHRIT